VLVHGEAEAGGFPLGEGPSPVGCQQAGQALEVLGPQAVLVPQQAARALEQAPGEGIDAGLQGCHAGGGPVGPVASTRPPGQVAPEGPGPEGRVIHDPPEAELSAAVEEAAGGGARLDHAGSHALVGHTAGGDRALGSLQVAAVGVGAHLVAAALQSTEEQAAVAPPGLAGEALAKAESKPSTCCFRGLGDGAHQRLRVREPGSSLQREVIHVDLGDQQGSGRVRHSRHPIRRACHPAASGSSESPDRALNRSPSM